MGMFSPDENGWFTSGDNVFIVKADNHDYDFMSEWWGAHAYANIKDAKKEVERLENEYWEKNPGSKKRGLPNVEIIHFKLK